MNKLLWLFGHFLYENKLTKQIIPPIVNYLKPDYISMDGHRVYIDKDDRVVSLELLFSKNWEEYERKLFQDAIKPGNTVVDIGAHIGTYTLVAARKVGPTGKVYAFEPLPKNFSLLKKNIEVNGYQNVVLINKAVSDKNGTAKLFLSNENNNGDQRIFNTSDYRKAIAVKTTSLDSFFGKSNECVNVIKMDIQGAEVNALKGAAELLKVSKSLKLFTEFWPKALHESGSSAKEYFKILKSNNFQIQEIDANKNMILKTSFEKLITKYPEGSMFNADLLCKKI